MDLPKRVHGGSGDLLSISAQIKRTAEYPLSWLVTASPLISIDMFSHEQRKPHVGKSFESSQSPGEFSCSRLKEGLATNHLSQQPTTSMRLVQEKLLHGLHLYSCPRVNQWERMPFDLSTSTPPNSWAAPLSLNPYVKPRNTAKECILCRFQTDKREARFIKGIVN